MKIKSYKGLSLEQIYEAIHKELGPEAVVLNPQKTRTLGGLLGRTQYEVIAVAEDAEADTHLLSASKMAALAQFEKITMQNNEKLQEMQGLFTDIKRDLKGISSGGMSLFPVSDTDVPEFAMEWDPRFIRKVKEKTGGKLDCDQKNLPELKQGVSGLLRVQENLSVGRIKNRPHVVVLTGPTGSGKTTTLAKLAARWSIEGKMKVGIVTADTYRVAAVDQIKEYALLLGIELKVAFSAGEAARAIEYFKDRDVVLVDTPGRNFYDQIGMSALKGMLQSMGKATLLLLVPATLEKGNISDLVKSYQILKPDYLVVTKVDETRRYGVFTTLICETQCPVVFLTNGQRVPQDIVSAKLEDIINMVMGDKKEINTKNPVVLPSFAESQRLKAMDTCDRVASAGSSKNPGPLKQGALQPREERMSRKESIPNGECVPPVQVPPPYAGSVKRKSTANTGKGRKREGAIPVLSLELEENAGSNYAQCKCA